MSNGRRLSEQNVAKFVAWRAGKSDDDFRTIANRGALSRKEVAKECGFAKSALAQNPQIKAALRELEDVLRLRGVLLPAVKSGPDAPMAPVTDESGHDGNSQVTERLRLLKQENAGLKAEVADLKRTIENYAVLRDALAMAERLPR